MAITVEQQASKTYLITVTRNDDNTFDTLQLPVGVSRRGYYSVLQGQVEYLVGTPNANLDLNSKLFPTVYKSGNPRIQLDRQFTTLNAVDPLSFRSLDAISYINFIPAD